MISNNGNTPEPTFAQTLSGVCDWAVAGSPQMDITIPDDTQMVPGEAFTKIWRVTNNGSCIWTTEYRFVFFSGDQLASTQIIQLNDPVKPSDEIDLVVEMTAPQEAGTYQSNWKLQNQQGEFFGIGPNGASPLWVRIEVIDNNTPTAQILPTITSTPTPSTMVSGDVLIRAGQLLDLDTLQIKEDSADLGFTSKDDTNLPAYQFQPRNNAKINLFGSARPTLNDCKTASLSNQPIELPGNALGFYYCYSTDLSLPGWFYLDNLDTEEDSLYLVIHTWLQP